MTSMPDNRDADDPQTDPNTREVDRDTAVEISRDLIEYVVSSPSLDVPTVEETMDVRAIDLPRARRSGQLSADGDDRGLLEALKNYAIQDKIGSGGCSTVYSATLADTGESVAIKVLRLGLLGSQRQISRFVQEAKAVERIKHSCIVPIYETGYLADGRPFLVMELVDGESLTQILFRRGRMSPREAFAVLKPVCAALALTHQANIVHRDIKASNIMISGTAENPEVRLLDFGIAKLLGNDSKEALQTSMGRVVGTPQSMAPEQILGHPVTGRTDIYALGVLLFRMLTGRHPYASPDPQVVVQMHMTAPPPKTSEFAPTNHAIDKVIARAMAKDPAHRFQDPQQLIEAFAHALRADSSGGVQVPTPALAIYVDARIPMDREVDEAIFENLMQALDMAVRQLGEHHYTIALQTSTAILGVRLLAHEPAVYQTARAQALLLADTLINRLRRLAGAPIHFNLSVHSDSALTQPGNQGQDTIGGPIMDIGAWAPVAPQDGVWLSPEIQSSDGRSTTSSS